MSFKSTNVDALTTLLHTHILNLLPTSRYHFYVCSAGSQGYHALKEMLQNGVPGNTLLIESGDLRDVGVGGGDCGSSDGVCCLLYAFHIHVIGARDFPYYTQNANTAHHLVVYGNLALLSTKNATAVTAPRDDPNPFTNVMTTGSYFLRECPMSSIDLSPLVRLSCIEESFMAECINLTTIDLSPLSQVTVVESGFMFGCTGLTTIDLSPLSKVTKIQLFFLAKCTGLTTIDLSGLSQVTRIESSFLKGCTGLTTIDLSPLTQLVEVGDSFLRKCKGLTTINIEPLLHVKVETSAFLEECWALESVDLSLFSELTELGSFFLCACQGLTTIDLSPLSKVTKIDRCFLARCPNLRTIDLRPLTNLVALPERFTEDQVHKQVLLPAHLE